MKHIIRLFILIAALVLGTDHAWADAESDPRVNFVYVDGGNYALNSEKGFAIASDADQTGQVTITVTINEGKDFRCIEGDLTAEQSINSNMGQARRRTSAEGPGNGVSVPVTCTNTNEFTLTLPDDKSTNVTVYVKFSPKLEFTPEVTIEGWTYGGTANEPSLKEYPSSDDDVTYTYATKADGTYTETLPTNAGTYFVKASVAATADYKACESAPVAFTISQAPLTVKANDRGIFYGNAAANNGVSYEGFVNNEDESVLGGTLTYTYSNNKGPYGEGNDAPGLYEIKPGGLDSKNYEITFVSGTLFVEPARVSVRVVDKADGKGIETASVTVQVLDNGNQVTVCQIGWSADINDLKAGKTYTLRETVAPEGYVLPSDLTLTIDNEGKVTSSGSTTTDEFGTVLLLENSKTKVEVSVVDIANANGAALVGAHVQVIEKTGEFTENVVEEWTSDGSTHTIEGLKTGVTYTLRETVAPNRYAAPADYTFKIAPDGSINFSGNKTENGVLLVENTQTGDLIVSNTLVSDLASDANQEFTFAVKATLNDQPISGTYGDMTFENGRTTFTLTKGGSMTAKDLLYGTNYIVNQVEAEGFTLKKTGDTGIIGQEYSTAAFTNTRKTGDLIVTNTVYSDSESDANQEFEFKVTLGDRSISGTYGGMMFLSGETTFTLTNGGSMTATGLPTTMTYTVTGPDVNGFQLYGNNVVEGVIGNEASTATFKYIKLINVSVAIRWNDANNQDGKRPSTVSVILKANGEQVGSKTLNEENLWKGTFEKLLSCKADGTPIEYSWEMPATPGSYTLSEPTVDGHNTTFTLTHETVKTQVTVQAIWDDENNKEGFRPENVSVKLIANGAEVGESEATLNAGNGWSHTWEVDKYANGQEVTFTVSQDKLDNYNDPVIVKANEAPLTYNVTNSRTVEKTEVKVSIFWVDQNNQEGLRPESVTVHLLKGNNECEAIVLSNSNNWTHTWANLQKYENAAAIDYTVTEEEVANYSTQITKATDGTFTYTVTNSRTLEVIDVSVAIVWDDDDNKNGFRPKNVNVKLIANRAEVEYGEVTLNADNDWTYNWTGRNKYADGQEIEYTISQEQLVNYNAPVITYSGTRWEYTVTNTICGVIFTTEGNSTTLTLTNPTALQEVSIPTPVEVDHVNIQRQFIPNTAATVYLPFTIAANNVEGGKFYSFTDVDETKNPWEVSYTEVTGNIAANTPYIFLPDDKHDGKITVNNGSDKLSVCTANPQTTTQGLWKFIGTYEPIKWLSDSEAEGYTAERAAEIGSVYGFAASGIKAGEFVKVASGAYIKPYRAYLKRTTTSGARGHNDISSPELPATMNVVLISANGVTVSVGTINLDCESGDWYSLDGRKLDAQPTKKGMYIHNNKKVIIK